MKALPYVVGAIIAGTIAAGSLGIGTSVAQTADLKGGEPPAAILPTPAKYAIGERASYDEVTRSLSEQGFEVVEYELDDRRIEVKGLTSTGHCLEIKFHPVSGKELRRERDDDCRPGNDFGDDWLDD